MKKFREPELDVNMIEVEDIMEVSGWTPGDDETGGRH